MTERGQSDCPAAALPDLAADRRWTAPCRDELTMPWRDELEMSVQVVRRGLQSEAAKTQNVAGADAFLRNSEQARKPHDPSM